MCRSVASGASETQEVLARLAAAEEAEARALRELRDAEAAMVDRSGNKELQVTPRRMTVWPVGTPAGAVACCFEHALGKGGAVLLLELHAPSKPTQKQEDGSWCASAAADAQERHPMACTAPRG